MPSCGAGVMLCLPKIMRRLSRTELPIHVLLRSVAFALAIIMTASVSAQKRKPPKSKATKNLNRALQELKCECITSPEGWRCDQLAGFADYVWTHEKIDEVALSIGKISSALPAGNFAVAIQGIADSQTIQNYKNWSQVEEDSGCRREEGLISNEDLAWLRSCFTKTAIEKATEIQEVELLDPIAHKPTEDKYGPQYKAAVIYLLGKNGACKR